MILCGAWDLRALSMEIKCDVNFHISKDFQFSQHIKVWIEKEKMSNLL